MPKKARKKSVRKHAKPQHGAGPAEVLAKVNQLAKDTKIISKALGMVDSGIARGIGSAAGQLGYGHREDGRERILRSQRGAGLGDVLAGLGQGIGGAAFGVGQGLKGLFGGQRGGLVRMHDPRMNLVRMHDPRMNLVR